MEWGKVMTKCERVGLLLEESYFGRRLASRGRLLE